MRPDIKAIKERCDAATPGPWFHDLGNWDVESRSERCFRQEICSVAPDHRQNLNGQKSIYSFDSADGEFIAACRQDIPSLLAYIERLEMVVEAAKQFVNTGNCTSEVPNGPGCGVDKLVDALKDLEGEG